MPKLYIATHKTRRVNTRIYKFSHRCLFTLVLIQTVSIVFIINNKARHTLVKNFRPTMWPVLVTTPIVT